MIIAFCGHAQFDRTEECEQKILSFLEEKAGDQRVEMYLGGYGDFDNFAYDCCKKYQRTHSEVSLLLITPYMTPEYQKNHLAYQRLRYDGIIYPEIEDKLPKYAISYRNKWMVEKADYVIAYIDHDWGGAYQTYQHAKRKGKLVFNLGKL